MLTFAAPYRVNIWLFPVDPVPGNQNILLFITPLLSLMKPPICSHGAESCFRFGASPPPALFRSPLRAALYFSNPITSPPALFFFCFNTGLRGRPCWQGGGGVTAVPGSVSALLLSPACLRFALNPSDW